MASPPRAGEGDGVALSEAEGPKAVRVLSCGALDSSVASLPRNDEGPQVSPSPRGTGAPLNPAPYEGSGRRARTTSEPPLPMGEGWGEGPNPTMKGL